MTTEQDELLAEFGGVCVSLKAYQEREAELITRRGELVIQLMRAGVSSDLLAHIGGMSQPRIIQIHNKARSQT